MNVVAVVAAVAEAKAANAALAPKKATRLPAMSVTSKVRLRCRMKAPRRSSMRHPARTRTTGSRRRARNAVPAVHVIVTDANVRTVANRLVATRRRSLRTISLRRKAPPHQSRPGHRWARKPIRFQPTQWHPLLSKKHRWQRLPLLHRPSQCKLLQLTPLLRLECPRWPVLICQ